MFSSVPAEILGLVAGWGFLLIVAAFCFPIRSSYQKPIGKGKIVTAAAVSSIVLMLGIGALSNLFLSWAKAGPSFLLWLTGIAVLEIGLLLAFTYRKHGGGVNKILYMLSSGWNTAMGCGKSGASCSFP